MMEGVVKKVMLCGVALVLARMDAPTGTILAYATAPGQKAEDGGGRNGTYTASLLKHLTLPDLSVQDMLNNTGLEVMKQPRNAQVPWISATRFPGFSWPAVRRKIRT